MDAEGRIIPVVEDDQGEGFRDELHDDIEALRKQLEPLMNHNQEKVTHRDQKMSDQIENNFTYHPP